MAFFPPMPFRKKSSLFFGIQRPWKLLTSPNWLEGTFQPHQLTVRKWRNVFFNGNIYIIINKAKKDLWEYIMPKVDFMKILHLWDAPGQQKLPPYKWTATIAVLWTWQQVCKAFHKTIKDWTRAVQAMHGNCLHPRSLLYFSHQAFWQNLLASFKT